MGQLKAPWEVEWIQHVRGQFLGASGLHRGPKATLFHGTKDEHLGLSESEGILSHGFIQSLTTANSAKAPPVFGKGVYFTEQACKAFQYAEHYLLVCEAVIGTTETRLRVMADDPSIEYDSKIDGL